jgi:hypothetical protein
MSSSIAVVEDVSSAIKVMAEGGESGSVGGGII